MGDLTLYVGALRVRGPHTEVLAVRRGAVVRLQTQDRAAAGLKGLGYVPRQAGCRLPTKACTPSRKSSLP